MIIKNFDDLAVSPERKTVLEIINAGLEAIQPGNVFNKSINLYDSKLQISNKTFDLSSFARIFVLGFGKGSGGIAGLLEKLLGDKITDGYVIDAKEEKLEKLNFTLGTHPLPSQENIKFTQNALFHLTNFTPRDLVFVIICGGGSAMLTNPQSISLDQLITMNKSLLRSGADIFEMNTIRKHVDSVKGGGLAKLLHPAHIVSLVFSDVPGNDLSFIASGPTVLDKTTIADAKKIVAKYILQDTLPFLDAAFVETPKEERLFTNVTNCIILSNLTALDGMKDKALAMGLNVLSFSDRVQGDASEVSQKLIAATQPGHILLAAGETTLKVTGDGKGGRNQHLVLSALPSLPNGTIIASFDSDGWDNTEFAGAIGDNLTKNKAEEKRISILDFLKNNDSFHFFEKVGDGIITGRLASNVSDIMLVMRK